MESYSRRTSDSMRSRSDAVIPEPLAEFDTDEWSKKDFTECVRIGTNLYVLKGLGYPLAAYLFHAVKLSLFVLGWVFFCRFTPGRGTICDFRWWMLQGPAFNV